METTIVYWGYIAIMEKKMDTAMVYWGYIGKSCPTGFKFSAPCVPKGSPNTANGATAFRVLGFGGLKTRNPKP